MPHTECLIQSLKKLDTLVGSDSAILTTFARTGRLEFALARKLSVVAYKQLLGRFILVDSFAICDGLSAVFRAAHLPMALLLRLPPTRPCAGAIQNRLPARTQSGCHALFRRQNAAARQACRACDSLLASYSLCCPLNVPGCAWHGDLSLNGHVGLGGDREIMHVGCRSRHRKLRDDAHLLRSA